MEMKSDDQYISDVRKLAATIKKYTGIPEKRMHDFIMENSAAQILPCANILCKTDAQREKLHALFEFKNVYETVKSADAGREHILNSTCKAKKYFVDLYADKNDKERVAVAFLDSKFKVIATKIMFTGSPNTANINMYELMKETLFFNSVSVVLAHNHISGVKRPSKEDIDATAKIKTLLNSVDVNLADHVIVTGDDAVSMADEGLLDMNRSMQGLAKVATSDVKEPTIKREKQGNGKQSILSKLERNKQKVAQQWKTDTRKTKGMEI
jgi:DNA repair protein RadC